MKNFLFLVLFLGTFTSVHSQISAKDSVDSLITNWHKDASDANYEKYFSLMGDASIFIGTDKTELWNKQQFQDFAKPYFDASKTWDFKTINRNIYFSKDGNVSWFDELLDTWMGVCRSSGVLEKENGEWELKHYQLSVTISNEKINDFIKISSESP